MHQDHHHHRRKEKHAGENSHSLQPAVTAHVNKDVWIGFGAISWQWLAQLKCGPTFRLMIIAVYAVAPPSPCLRVHARQSLASLVGADKDCPILYLVHLQL